ncbi:MAG: hypothetical protein HY825_12360 [Acidobacteria bacterium]|nr:hypothetical protein [Acidobacteriota bacterium]
MSLVHRSPAFDVARRRGWRKAPAPGIDLTALALVPATATGSRGTSPAPALDRGASGLDTRRER